MPGKFVENFERSDPPHRLFFALRPAASVRPRILGVTDSLFDAYKLRGSATAAERLHVTLWKIGEFAGGIPRQVLFDAQRVAARLADSTRSFQVQFNHVMSFGHRGRRASVVLCGDDGVVGIERLQRDLHRTLRGVGLAAKSNSGFNPHVTLVYGSDRAVEEQDIEPIGWKATELVLIDSLLGHPARHGGALGAMRLK